MSASISGARVAVNGRDYRWPATPTVVVCLDGSEPGYIETAIEQRPRPQPRPADARAAPT